MNAPRPPVFCRPLAALLLMLVLWGIAATAHAQGNAPPGAAVGAVGELRAIFGKITTALDAFGAGNSGLVAIGKRTAVVLFGVLLVWGMIRSWILGKGFAQLLPEFIQPLVIFGLTFWAVDHLGPAVKASVQALGGVFAQTLSLPAGPPDEVDIIDRMAEAGFAIVNASAANSATDWIGAIGAALERGIGFMFRLAAATLLLAAGAVATGVMMMAKVQTALAILFAPVMIPWAMWQPTTFLFNAWLTFLIGGAMQGVMAAAVASLSLNIVDSVVSVAKTMSGVEGVSYITCCVILLMAVLIGFMFTKVPALTAALVGSSAIGMERWASVAQATGNAVHQVGGAVGKVAGSVASGGYQFGKGAIQGFGGRGGGASSPAGAAGAPAPKPAAGLAGAAGRAAGKAAGAAARALGSGGTGPGGAPAFPSAPPAAAPRAGHQPFRPKGARPVNRPMNTGGAGS